MAAPKPEGRKVSELTQEAIAALHQAVYALYDSIPKVDPVEKNEQEADALKSINEAVGYLNDIKEICIRAQKRT